MNKRDLLAHAFDALGLSRVVGPLSRWRGLLVFNYHRIGSPDQTGCDPGLWSATPEQFDAQIRFLKDNYPIIGLDDLANVAERPDQQRVMITFDDGYRDNHDLAFPILQQNQAKAVFFLATGFLDQPRLAWWDQISCIVRSGKFDEIPFSRWLDSPLSCVNGHRPETLRKVLQTYKQLPAHELESYLNFLEYLAGDLKYPCANELWLTWDQVRRMAAGGMEFGAHTVNHPILANHPDDVQSWEVHESKRRIETEIGGPISAFSYPVGSHDAFDQITRASVRAAGFDWAFSFCCGDLSWNGQDRFEIPRVPVELNTTLPRFRAMTALPKYFLS